MNVGIIGCGLIGGKRAGALGAHHRLIAVADSVPHKAHTLASLHPGCAAFSDWRRVVSHPEIDVVIVATTNDALVPVAVDAAREGKHLLVEKPGARTLTEMDDMIEAADKHGVRVKVGFNHRFHPAVLKAREIFSSGALGPLLYLRGRYGHGGRLGYEKEWRADPKVAGGGELLDQGIHLIDLARWFAGDFQTVEGRLATFFWDMPVEDNCFMLLTTASRQVAFLHVSWTEWKNLFSFEIFGRNGKVQIDGLGGSYGMEHLTHYQMRPEMGLPETASWTYPGEDLSWAREVDYFMQCIRENTEIEGGLEDARAALAIAMEVYRRHSSHGRGPHADHP